MGLIRKVLCRLANRLRHRDLMPMYEQFVQERDLDEGTLRERQNTQLRLLVRHAVENVPYYGRLFKERGLRAADIQTTEDLQKLPVLTKDIIRKNQDDFASRAELPYKNGSTGGSTGDPLKYRMSPECQYRGVALLYRGLSEGGYEPGDPMLIMAGGSLTDSSPTLRKRLVLFTLNFRSVSSYGITENTLRECADLLKRHRPCFLRGYATSFYVFAKLLRREGRSMEGIVPAIFSTGEMLLPGQRRLIEQVFAIRVFDDYGLNDGGVSAYECREHNGMHIDYERAVLETTDAEGVPVKGAEGRILATSLYNYAMPFIRYDTGDMATIRESHCPCGCKRPLLMQLKGRTTDYLDIHGTLVGSPVLTVLMGKTEAEQYQIVQKSADHIVVRIVKSPRYGRRDEEFIRSSLVAHLPQAEIEIAYVDEIVAPDGQKHKFIINEYARVNGVSENCV
jgi:phenylacetate-coenzyme A ligase PaaK-like adenylate-forming protein